MHVVQEAVQRLMEMGFSEDDILHALETCANNFEDATAWLLGDREVTARDQAADSECSIP
jgi:uncharacterized UBP type Zn finger protein